MVETRAVDADVAENRAISDLSMRFASQFSTAALAEYALGAKGCTLRVHDLFLDVQKERFAFVNAQSNFADRFKPFGELAYRIGLGRAVRGGDCDFDFNIHAHTFLPTFYAVRAPRCADSTHKPGKAGYEARSDAHLKSTASIA